MWLCLDCHAVSLTPLASAAARILRPPGAPTVGAGLPPPGAAKRTGRTAPGRGVAAALPPGVTRRNTHEVIRSRPRPQVWCTANSAGGGYRGSAKPGQTRREPIRIRRTGGADVAAASGDRAGLTA